MNHTGRHSMRGSRAPLRLVFLFVFLVMILGDCRPATAIPSFARKYGMPCSACHDAWPHLSAFGQQFKDNGYQMGNDRDAPIFQQAAYWPVAFRITPQWHRESQNRVGVDGPDESTVEAQVTTHGFDFGGMDILTAGTLAKNVSFLLVPSMENDGTFGIESAWARFDNLLGSSWLNVKMGKLELDNLLSEKRIMTLSGQGGFYQNYHFQPVGEDTDLFTFGLGDNQVGLEWMGHSKNDHTRLSAALLSSTDGEPNLPTSRAYNVFLAGSQAFQVGSLGLQRVGAFAYLGQAPTYFQFTAGGAPVAGTGIGNRGFQRYGLIGMWYIKKFDITTMYFRGHDDVYLGTNTPSNQPDLLPVGAQSPSWNGGLFESHYNVNPQLVLINRYELIRMSQQALPDSPGNLGNIDALTFGLRYYPFMSSRAGFAFHNEYSIVRQRGVSPVTGRDLTSSSLMFGFDFAF
jgi:hypothetical protein